MQSRSTTGTRIGLFIAFFGGPLVIYLFSFLQPPDGLTNSFIVLRELCLFFLAAVLILIIVKVEKLGLDSIGLHNRHWGKSLLSSLGLLGVCFLALLGCLGLLQLFGISFGSSEGARKYDEISLWVMTLMVLRAGVVEE